MSSAAFSSASFSTPSASSPYKPSSKKRGRGVSEPHPVLCPICSVHFRAAPEPSVPHRLPCAHCVCLPCLEAYALSDEEGCPVCRKPAEPHVLDLTLASYAEDVYLQASGGACPAAVSVPAAVASAFEDPGRSLSMGRATLVTKFQDSVSESSLAMGPATLVKHVYEDSERSVTVARAALTRAVGCSIAGSLHLKSLACNAQGDAKRVRTSAEDAKRLFKEEVAVARAALDAAEHCVLAQLSADCHSREKALGAVADELTVSASHLDTVTALGHAALASGNPGRMELARQCVRSANSLSYPSPAAHGVAIGIPMIFCDGVVTAIATLAPTQAGVLLCKQQQRGVVNAETFGRLLSVAHLPDCSVSFCEAVADACARAENGRVAAGPAVVAAVLAAMEVQPACAELQEQGLRALSNLAGPEDITEACEAGNVAACLPGLQVILTAMGTHILQYSVSLWGCTALYRLGRDPAGRAALVAAGGFARVIATMEEWEFSQELAVQGCAALANFWLQCPQGRAAFATSGGLARLLRILSAWPTSALVNGIAVAALINVSYDNVANNKAIVVSSGCLASVCAAMAAFPGTHYIQRMSSRFLRSLALIPEGKAALLAGRGVELLERAAATHPDCAEHAAAALLLLRSHE